MKTGKMNIQDIYLEQAAIGELSKDQLARIESQPDFSSEQFEEQVHGLRAANETFHARIDSEKMLQAIRAKAFSGDLNNESVSVFADPRKDTVAEDEKTDEISKGKTISFFKKAPRWTAALAAALPLFLIIGFVFRMGMIDGSADPTLEPGIRTKGLEPRIFIYRDLGAGEVELLQRNDSARENDNLQISYLAAGKNYGVILSIDGSNVITLHCPENSNMLPRLQPTDEVYLPYGYRLDDAPDFERFFFITSDEAFDVRQLMASIAPQLRSSTWRSSGELDLPDEFSVYRIDLDKPAGRR